MLELVTIRERPDLRSAVLEGKFNRLWPAFMLHDPVADLYFGPPHFDRYLDTAFAVIDPAAPGRALGRAFAVPFVFGGPGREELPDSGWDGVIRWAHEDQALGRRANALSALEITLLPECRGQGASRVVLDGIRRQAGGWAMGSSSPRCGRQRSTRSRSRPWPSTRRAARRRGCRPIPGYGCMSVRAARS